MTWIVVGIGDDGIESLRLEGDSEVAERTSDLLGDLEELRRFAAAFSSCTIRIFSFAFYQRFKN